MARPMVAQSSAAVVAKDPLSAAEPAANDGDAARSVAIVPRYVITPQMAATFQREAVALDAADVKPLPRDAHEQLSWMERTQGAAWRDQRELALVSDESEAAVTRDDIDTFGARIEWVRGAIVSGRASTTATVEGVAAMPTVTLRGRIEAEQKTLHNALMHRFRNNAEERRRLRDAQQKGSKTRVSTRSSLLLSMSAAPEVEAWLRGLPRGEGASLDALRVMHPAWVQRLKTGDASVVDGAPVDLAARAFATLKPTHERLVAAGRYLTRGRPERKGDYAGYRRPASRKPRKTPVTPPVG